MGELGLKVVLYFTPSSFFGGENAATKLVIDGTFLPLFFSSS